MRIAIDINGIFERGSGLGRYIKSLVKILSSIDAENEYFLYLHYFNMPKNLEQLRCSLPDNFKVICKKIPETISLISEHIFGLQLTDFLLRGYKIDIFHGPANLIPIFKDVRTILTVHHYLPAWHPLYPKALSWRENLYFRLTDDSIKKADFIITDSESTKNDIMKTFNIDMNKVLSIYPGEPDPIFKPMDFTCIGIPKYILFSGPINERKNLPNLLRAFKIVKKKFQDYKLVITGGGKMEYIATIKDFAKNLGLENEVIFMGTVDDVKMAELYNSAALLVYPSLYEGFGYPPLEAMSCGCPVVASNVTSIPEIVGDAAILFDPCNIEEMAQAMERVLKDSNLRKVLVERGFEQVKKFSWEKTARETIEVYRKVYNLKK